MRVFLRKEGVTPLEALIIVPTYNERENIHALLTTVLGIDAGIAILVVDDNSPDGTGAIVDSIAKDNPRVQVIHREGKLGLGSAYITGFKWALANTDAKYIFEMDADFSHDPKYIRDFLDAIEDHDLVIGSRYLHGVTVVNWPLSRLILSCGANIYTRLVTGLPLKDSTGGFKCFRREVLGQLPLDSIKSDGYSFQIEVNFLCWKKGFRITEIPIVFVDRRIGISKMSRKIIWEAAFMVWRLRFMRPSRWK
jgi:dolichol-phosphate mannosyltransferase